MSINETDLTKLPSFSGIPDSAIRDIAKISIPRTYAKGQDIYLAGKEMGRFYILLSGDVDIYRGEAGKRIVIQSLKPGDFFGDISFAGHASSFLGNSARAKTEARTASMQTEDMERLLRSSLPFALFLLTALRDRLHYAESKIKDLAISSAETRVINELLRYVMSHGKEDGGYWKIEKKLTHQSIADLSGVARETATKILKTLEKERVIAWSADGALLLHQENIAHICPQCLSLKTFSSKMQSVFGSLFKKNDLR